MDAFSTDAIILSSSINAGELQFVSTVGIQCIDDRSVLYAVAISELYISDDGFTI